MPNNRLALPGVGAPRKSLIRHCCVFPVWKNEHPNSVFSVPWQPGVFSVCTLGRSTSFTLDLSVKHSVPYPFPPVSPRVTIMVYFHQWIRNRTQIPNPIITLHYAVLPLHGLRLILRYGSLSQMVSTVPI